MPKEHVRLLLRTAVVVTARTDERRKGLLTRRGASELAEIVFEALADLIRTLPKASWPAPCANNS